MKTVEFEITENLEVTMLINGLLEEEDIEMFWKGGENNDGSESVLTENVGQLQELYMDYVEEGKNSDFQIWSPDPSFAKNIDFKKLPALVNKLREMYEGLEVEYTGKKVDELLEKWIIIMFSDVDNDAIRMTKRAHFENTNLCEYFGDYGVKLGCYDAGCYSFENSGSSIHSDFLLEVEKQFNVKIHNYFGERHGMSFDSVANFIDLVSELNDEDAEAHKSFDYSIIDLAKLKSFAENWKKENETHTEVKAWTYHDSHNFKTVVLENDSGDPDCTELDENEQVEILIQYPGFPHIEGTDTSEETESFIFHFDHWATNPWICFVERK